MDAEDLLVPEEGYTLQRGVKISDCGTYRYWLSRRWGPGPTLVFLLFNPSTADHLKDDQTVRRCMYFAKRAGYGGIVILNLYAYRTAYPTELAKAAGLGKDIVGPENLWWIRDWTKTEDKVVLAWGGMSFKAMDQHQKVIQATFQALPRDVSYLCLGTTTNESPRHPSRLGNAVKFEDYLPGVEWLPTDSAAYRKIVGARRASTP